MYGMEHAGWAFGGGFMMLLWWLLPVAVAAAIAAYLVKDSSRNAARSDALQDFEERQVRGDTGKDEAGQT